MRAELQTLHAAIETVGNARQRWGSRASVRLILDDGAGHVGLGEAAPLPGISKETVPEVRLALEAVAWPRAVPRTLDEVWTVVETIDCKIPSARFAAETALLSMMTTIRDRPLWSVWTERLPEPIPIAAALWGEDVESITIASSEAAAFEAQAVKLKVGRGPLDRAMLDAVRARLPYVELRLDANGTLPPDDLAARLDELAGYDPSFLEEPSVIEAVFALAESPFPLALDESLADGWADRALDHAPIAVLVLKPSLLGGLNPCWELAQRAFARGRTVVISHLFESTIARAASAHLALALNSGEAVGLGDHPALLPLSDGLTANWIDLAWIEPPELAGLGLELAW